MKKLFFALFLLLVFVPLSFAQQPSRGGPVVSLGAAYIPESAVDNGLGEFSATVVGGEASYRFLTVHAARGHFSWDNVASLPFGNGTDDPWDDLNKVGFSLRHGGKINPNWGYFAGGGISASFEEDLGMLSYSVNGGASYKINEKVRAQFGLMLGYNSIRSSVFPMIGLQIGQGGGRGTGFSASIGWPRLSVGYRFSPQWAVKAGLSLDNRAYQLASGGIYNLRDDSPVSPDGFIGFTGYSPSLSLEYAPIPAFQITLGAAWRVNSEMTIYDEGNNEVDEFDVDDSLGGSLRLQYRF